MKKRTGYLPQQEKASNEKKPSPPGEWMLQKRIIPTEKEKE